MVLNLLVLILELVESLLQHHYCLVFYLQLNTKEAISTNEPSPNGQQQQQQQSYQQQLPYSPSPSSQVRYTSPINQSLSVQQQPAICYTPTTEHYHQQQASPPPPLLAIQHHPVTTNIQHRFTPTPSIGRTTGNGQPRYDSPSLEHQQQDVQQRYAATPIPGSQTHQLLPPQEQQQQQQQLQGYQHHNHQDMTPPPELEYIHHHHQMNTYGDTGNPSLQIKNEGHDEGGGASGAKLSQLQTLKNEANSSNNTSITPPGAATLTQQIAHQTDGQGTTYTTLETVSSANTYHATYTENTVPSPYQLQQTSSLSSPGYSPYLHKSTNAELYTLYPTSAGGMTNKVVSLGSSESPLIYTKSDPTLTSTSISVNSKSSAPQLYSGLQGHNQSLSYEQHQPTGSPNSQQITLYGHGGSASYISKFSMSTDPSTQYWTTSGNGSPTAIDYVGSGYGGTALQNSVVTDGVTTSSPMQQTAYTTFGTNGGAGPSTSWNMAFDDNYDPSEYNSVFRPKSVFLSC